jgi:signal transduction histidine kinase
MAGVGRLLDEHRAHIRFLENLELVDETIKRETDLERMLWRLMKTVFSIFGCDRAWLFHPCDPSSPTFRVPVEVTRPEYPGAMVLNIELPMPPDIAEDLHAALASDGPVVSVEGSAHPVNRSTVEGYGVRSQMFMAIYPRVGQPWVFGMHQCSAARVWTDGERRLFQEIGGRLADGLSTLLMFRDLQESEARLRQSQKMDALGRLAGGIAHDFNNMLSVIIGNADLALAEARAGQTPLESLTEIRAAAERSSDLTGQLLAFARRQPVSPRPLELNAGVSGMMRMLQRLVGEDIDLDWRPGAPGGEVRMDPTQFDQILINLCVNARDAIGKDGRITVSTEVVTLSAGEAEAFPGAAPGTYARLTVADDGVGMEPAILSLIFEPFFTTKAPGKGTGLGLSTVFGIVEQNGGFIRVESAPGRGATFWVHLPVSEHPVDSSGSSEPDAVVVN